MISTGKKPFSLPKRQYLSEKVASIIRDRIYALEFSPGERLIVETLAQEMEVSMTPIREGLKELVSQGLVFYDGKSYSIMNPTPEEIMNLMDIRSYMEQLSANQAACHMKNETVEQLMTEYKEFANSDRIENGNELIYMDQLFHRTIIDNANNPRLQNMLKVIQDQCWLIRHWGFAQSYFTDIAKVTISDHIKILEAIKLRDSEKAEKLMRKHLQGARERTFEVINAKGFDSKS